MTCSDVLHDSSLINPCSLACYPTNANSEETAEMFSNNGSYTHDKNDCLCRAPGPKRDLEIS